MKFVRWIDKLNESVGIFSAWLVIPMMSIVLYQVVVRDIFNSATMWTYDTLWMLYSANFMLGGAYTLLHKGHIRIDIIQEKLSFRGKIVFDTMIYLFVFFLPSIVLTWVSAGYAYEAWATGENLSTTTWIFSAGPAKSVMPLAFFLLSLQSLGEVIRNVHSLRKRVEL